MRLVNGDSFKEKASVPAMILAFARTNQKFHGVFFEPSRYEKLADRCRNDLGGASRRRGARRHVWVRAILVHPITTSLAHVTCVHTTRKTLTQSTHF